MRILIIGASGLIGGALYKQLKRANNQVLGTYNTYPISDLIPLDFTRRTDVEHVINKFNPQVIINPAAFADVEGCEKDPKFCRKINFDGVRNIVDCAKQNNIPFVFFSSDYIFDGLSGPYKENDNPNPLNVYGKVKVDMENYIKSNLNKYLIIRTCSVFGWEAQGKNFVSRLVNKLKTEEPTRVVNDQYGSPTYSENLSRVVIYLLENGRYQTYHVAGKDTIDRYSFALLIAEVFNLNKELLISVTTDQTNQLAKRPMKGGLKVDKVQAILPFPLLTAREGLEAMKVENLL